MAYGPFLQKEIEVSAYTVCSPAPIHRLVQRLDRLSVLMCWMLAVAGGIYSIGVAAVGWLSRPDATQQQLETAVAWGPLLGLQISQNWLRLADMAPEREDAFVEQALEADPRNLTALLRLALRREFAGDRNAARDLVTRATTAHRTYPAFMAALTQAARWKEPARIETLAATALEYCPRDADGVWAQLPNLAVARRVLARRPSFQEDYLRYLIATDRADDARDLAASLPRNERFDHRRTELVELLWRKGLREEAGELFSSLSPEFDSEGTFNTRLRSRPTSIGFDWRISNDPAVQLDWRPGDLRIHLQPVTKDIEILSTWIRASKEDPRLVVPLWTGDTTGMNWRIESAGGPWRRVSLVAPAGAERRIALAEVRYE